MYHATEAVINLARIATVQTRHLFCLLDSEVTMTLLWMITLSAEWPGCVLCGRAVVQRGYHWALSSQGKSHGPSPAIRKLSFASVMIQSQFSTSKFGLGEESIFTTWSIFVRTLSDRLSLSVLQGYYLLQSSCFEQCHFPWFGCRHCCWLCIKTSWRMNKKSMALIELSRKLISPYHVAPGHLLW